MKKRNRQAVNGTLKDPDSRHRANKKLQVKSFSRNFDSSSSYNKNQHPNNHRHVQQKGAKK